MTLPAILRNARHSHVTEREGAHRWPDGRYDDASWEDCTFVAGLELARVCHDPSIPATHFEAERLRQSSGKGPSGGSNTDDLREGYARRYRWFVGSALSGFSALWGALRPGHAAGAAVYMGAFPSYHRLRRWDRGFGGKHFVLVARVDSTDRVWWCDPLAPQGSGYEGEWVTKAELKKAVDRITPLGGRHVVGVIRRPVVAPRPPDTSTAPATQESFVSYPVPKVPSVCTIPKGTRLYTRSSLVASPTDVIVSPGRTMPYLGQPTASARVVEYVNAAGAHTGRAFFVKAAAATSIRAR